jgi:pyridoxine kinase
MPSLQKALQILHEKYQVPNVVISSIPLKPWLLAALPSYISPSHDVDDPDAGLDWLFCLSSSIKAINDATIPPNTRINGSKLTENSSIIHAACVPLIPGYFSGVGDLFSAFVLSHFHPSPAVTLNSTTKPLSPPSKLTHTQTAFSYAVSLALTKTHAILSKTHEYSLSLPEEERLPSDDELDAKYPMRKIRRMRGRELAIVQNQDIVRGIGLDTINTRWMGKWDTFWES